MVRISEQLVRKKSEHNECLINSLEELSLHQEDIECIEHLHNWCRELKILLLQSNLISKIENLFKLKKLEYLNLAVNCIERIENLEKLESLSKLDLTLNFIGELTSIESLRNNYNLRELILTGNPCCDYPNYREYVIATLPQLNNFDCEEITVTKRLQAQKQLKQYREVIVQKQADYAMQRDEQKVRVQQQQADLQMQMANVDNEEERTKLFWNTKSEHCPETRVEIAKHHKSDREKIDFSDKNQTKKSPKLFAPCGRPYSLNHAKLDFNFKDETNEYILELRVFKFLDTSLIDVDVQANYIRVTVKGKLFQIGLSEEVNTSEAIVQRSQITGALLVRVPKLKANEMLFIKAKKDTKESSQTAWTKEKKSELKGTVDIKHICNPYEDLPDLV